MISRSKGVGAPKLERGSAKGTGKRARDEEKYLELPSGEVYPLL